MIYSEPFLLPANRVWRSYKGGKCLDEIQGEPEPKDSHFPEDWIGSATTAINPGREEYEREGISTVISSEGDAIAMDGLLEAAPEEILGSAHIEVYGKQPQLLVKYLDSKERLQIQAHPTVSWAKERLNSSNGKTEAWWFLNARDEEDSWVLFGFQNPVPPEEWGRILKEQDKEAMMACFKKVPVKSGDVLLVEGGVPHAIGPGLLMVEVMEPTDWVVRCEFFHSDEKNDPKSQCMGMEINEILDMFDYTAVPAEEVPERFGPNPVMMNKDGDGSEVQLFARPQTDRLEMRRVEVNGRFELADDDRFSILLILDGKGILSTDESEFTLKKWDKVLIPSACSTVNLIGEFTIARCMPPKPEEVIR